MDSALIIFNIINTYIIFYFLKKTYGYKYEKMYVNAIGIIAFNTIHTFINLYHLVTVNIVMEFIMINTFSYLFFNHRSEKFYYNSFFQFYILSIDLVMTSISSIYNKVTFVEAQVNFSNIPFFTVNFIILLLTYKKVVQAFEHNYLFFDSFKNKIKLSILILVQYIIFLALSVNYHAFETSVIGLILVLFIIIVNAVIVFSLVYAQKKDEDREKLEIYKEYLNEIRNQIEKEKIAKSLITEIFLNHTEEAKMVENKSQAEKNLYLKRMKAKIKSVDLSYECGNSTINAIVASTVSKTTKKGIEFENDIEIINWDFINNQEIMIIMLCLINNAIDTMSDKKKLTIKVRKAIKGNIVLVKVIHSCDVNQIEENSHKIFASQNKTVKLRTNIAFEVVKRNQANLSFYLEDGNFVSRIFLSTNK